MVNSCPPYPILRVLDSKAHVLHAIEATSTKKHNFSPENGEKCHFSARNKAAPPKWPFFLPQKGQFWPQNSVFWAWVASSRPPHAISQVPDSKKHVL